MQRQATFGRNTNPFADAALAASRQVWLAGLGAAAITRDWARREAGKTFRALVKEGAAVENQAIRLVSDRLQTSISTASSLWSHTRAAALTTANNLTETAVAALSKFKTPSVARTATTAKPRKTAKPAKKRAARSARRGERGARKA